MPLRFDSQYHFVSQNSVFVTNGNIETLYVISIIETNAETKKVTNEMVSLSKFPFIELHKSKLIVIIPSAEFDFGFVSVSFSLSRSHVDLFVSVHGCGQSSEYDEKKVCLHVPEKR